MVSGRLVRFATASDIVGVFMMPLMTWDMAGDAKSCARDACNACNGGVP